MNETEKKLLQVARQDAIDILNDDTAAPLFHEEAARLASAYLTLDAEFAKAQVAVKSLQTKVDDLQRWRPKA